MTQKPRSGNIESLYIASFVNTIITTMTKYESGVVPLAHFRFACCPLNFQTLSEPIAGQFFVPQQLSYRAFYNGDVPSSANTVALIIEHLSLSFNTLTYNSPW